MSRMMLLGALRAPAKASNFMEMMQFKGRAEEAADEIEKLDNQVAVLSAFVRQTATELKQAKDLNKKDIAWIVENAVETLKDAGCK